MTNPDIRRLHAYPFERLRTLLDGITPPAGKSVIALSIGEPKHRPPDFIVDYLREHAADITSYPSAKGEPSLREAAAAWLCRRYHLRRNRLSPDHHVLPLSGSREGLFAFVQAMVDRNRNPLVMFPNPFYQIYEGATFLAGATPCYINTTSEQGFIPHLEQIPERLWQRCQLLILCSPGNPTGAALQLEHYRQAFELADRYGFIVASDECYAEIYRDETHPPLGLLEACEILGRPHFERAVAIHSLSKRSSVPGLRSGFIAGDAQLIKPLLAYRTYHGCALPRLAQMASALAWQDDEHARDNRRRYQRKFEQARQHLEPVAPLELPDGGFYLWLPVPRGDDEDFARRLYADEGLVVLPGRYLSRATDLGDPGEGFVRVSLVPEESECEVALKRLAGFYHHYHAA